jgi:hypothetical protein
VGYFCNFHATAQSKKSLIGRKFAHSGHPVQATAIREMKNCDSHDFENIFSEIFEKKNCSFDYNYSHLGMKKNNHYIGFQENCHFSKTIAIY